MRTTLDLDDRLIRRLKKQAAESGQTLTSLIEAALRESFARQNAVQKTPFRLRWVTVRGRLQPGVDLTDRDSLYDRMEERS